MTVTRPVLYGDLLHSERRLVAMMQRLQFGHFSRLRIHAGEAVLSPWPATVRGIKFGDKAVDQIESFAENVKLPRQISELLGYIRSIGTGEILALEFRHALPFRMEIEAAEELDDAGGRR
jgi:hypothetical protein